MPWMSRAPELWPKRMVRRTWTSQSRACSAVPVLLMRWLSSHSTPPVHSIAGLPASVMEMRFMYTRLPALMVSAGLLGTVRLGVVP